MKLIAVTKINHCNAHNEPCIDRVVEALIQSFEDGSTRVSCEHYQTGPGVSTVKRCMRQYNNSNGRNCLSGRQCIWEGYAKGE